MSLPATTGSVQVLDFEDGQIIPELKVAQRSSEVLAGGGSTQLPRFGTTGTNQESYAFASPGHSLWHVVALQVPKFDDASPSFNFVVEVPKDGMEKHEVELDTPGNPISINKKASAALKRFGVPVPFNYGIFPQTYCHPEVMSELGVGGDKAPLDVVELSGVPLAIGEIREVKILGAICVVDKGELDWKIFTVCSNVFQDEISKLGYLLAGVKFLREARAAKQWFMDWYAFKKQASNKATEFPYGTEIFPPPVAMSRIYMAHKGWLALFDSEETQDKVWLSPNVKKYMANSGKRARVE